MQAGDQGLGCSTETSFFSLCDTDGADRRGHVDWQKGKQAAFDVVGNCLFRDRRDGIAFGQ